MPEEYSWSPPPAHFSSSRRGTSLWPLGLRVSGRDLTHACLPRRSGDPLISTQTSSTHRREAAGLRLYATARKTECGSGRQGRRAERRGGTAAPEWEWKTTGSSQATAGRGRRSAPCPLLPGGAATGSRLFPSPAGQEAAV